MGEGPEVRIFWYFFGIVGRFSLPEELSGSQEALKDRLLDEASRLEAENPDPSSLAS